MEDQLSVGRKDSLPSLRRREVRPQRFLPLLILVVIAIVFGFLGNRLGKWLEDQGRLPFLTAGDETDAAQRRSERIARLSRITVPPGASSEYVAMLELGQRYVRDLLAVFPTAPQALAAAARLQDLAHDTVAEIEAWKMCLELQPDYEAAYARLCSLAKQEGDFVKVIDWAQAARSHGVVSAEVRMMLAEALVNLGRKDEAKQELTALVQDHPDNVQARFLLGHVYLDEGQPAQAADLFESVVRAAPSHAAAFHGLSMAYVRLERLEDAQKASERLTELKKAESEAQRLHLADFNDARLAPQVVSQIATETGRLLMKIHATDQAQATLHHAIELDPTNLQAIQLLSDLYYQQQHYPQALKYVWLLRSLEPDNPAHHQNYGRILARWGKLKDAETAFRNLAMAFPRSSLGYSALAELYIATQNDAQEAVQLAEKAVYCSRAAKDYAILALAHQQAGNVQQAQVAIKEAIRLEPSNPHYTRIQQSLAQQAP